MVRDLNKEAKKIRNGNRFVEESEGKGVFSRDVDRLFLEYTNLRKKIYNMHAGAFNDEATKEELRSYIDEQFIKLVKEYDINSPVDFPGYINKKLKLRVKQTFVKNKFKERGREKLMSKDDGVSMLLDNQIMEEDSHLDFVELDTLHYLFGDMTFSKEEEYILQIWLYAPVPDNKLINQVSNVFGISKKEAKRIVINLKNSVKDNL